MNTQTTPLVISLGGSILSTKEDNSAIVQTYVDWLLNLAKTRRVAVIIGGGYRARFAMEQAQQDNPYISHEQLDEIGITASRANAEVMRKLCGVTDEIITDPRVPLKAEPGLVFGAGWIPGRSTDYDAALLAITNNISTVYNLSNITQIYSQDPKIYPDAKPLNDITWADLQKIVGNAWTPGLNMPFDPTATTLAAAKGLTVKVVNGHTLAEVNKAINGELFIGTVVHP